MPSSAFGRCLGSFQDAEDALQDTLLSAWPGLSGYRERASLRTWLYRIATNRCLNARRAADRRPAAPWSFGEYRPPEPTRIGEVDWLEPYPDAYLGAVVPGPDARYEQSESMSLAFVTALQTLPPRQVAVLILRDVLGFPAALVAKFAAAYEAADLNAVIALLTDDVFMSMPPIPLEYEGHDLVGRFCASLFSSGRRFRLLATRANLRPAFAAYVIGPDGRGHAAGLLTVTLTSSGIKELSRFDTTALPAFGLPRTIELP